MQVWCFHKLIWVFGLEGHRYLIQMGGSGCADLCIHMKEPSAPCHKQGGVCLSAGRHFSSQGSIGWFFWGPFLPPQWAVVYVLVPCHESRLSSPSCCWWTHECWPKPRSKEWRPPDAETDSLSCCFFFLYGLLLERFWQGANILEDSEPSQSSSTTCPERCWLETNWFLELLEWVFRLTGVNLIPQEKLHLKVKLHRSQSPAAEA